MMMLLMMNADRVRRADGYLRAAVFRSDGPEISIPV